MTSDIRYLIFKGIDKKEQILFKSFLNLAKNELTYQVTILKENQMEGVTPDMVIVDDQYKFTSDEASFEALASITVGDDLTQEKPCYLTRPVQWSDFKVALTELDGGGHNDVLHAQPETADSERVLPTAMQFAIDDIEEESADEEEGADDEEDLDQYEYELDKMSIDYNSFTNSDYMQVVDDVQQFKEGNDALDVVPDPVILMTDDESGSTNSVLVIETNSLDAWDFSMSEMSESPSTSSTDGIPSSEPFEKEKEAKKSTAVKKSGFDLVKNEQYWMEDNEIIADEVSVLFIKTQRGMVYSAEEPGKWPIRLQNKTLSKIPLQDDWRPKKGLHAYPMSRLLWVNSLINETDELTRGLVDNEEYMLERWPHFDLLELDNVLLKLCSMLFVKAESLDSLVKKSGYGRSTVRGLMNACYKEGILRKADEIQVENLVAANNEDGVFGKIKDVFR